MRLLAWLANAFEDGPDVSLYSRAGTVARNRIDSYAYESQGDDGSRKVLQRMRDRESALKFVRGKRA